MSDYQSVFTPDQIPEAQRITKALMDTKLSELWDENHVQAFCKYAEVERVTLKNPGEPTVDDFLNLHGRPGVKGDPRVAMFSLLQSFAEHESLPPHREGMITLYGLSYGLAGAARAEANRESLGKDVQDVNKMRALVWARVADTIEDLNVVAGIQQEKEDPYRTLGLPRPGEKAAPQAASTPAPATNGTPEQNARAMAATLLNTPLSRVWGDAQAQAFAKLAGKYDFEFHNPAGPTIEDFLFVGSMSDPRIRSLAPLHDIVIGRGELPAQPELSMISGTAAGIAASYQKGTSQQDISPAQKEAHTRDAQVMAEVAHAIDQIRVTLGHIKAEEAPDLYALLGITRPGANASKAQDGTTHDAKESPAQLTDAQRKGHETLRDALNQPLSEIWPPEGVRDFVMMMRSHQLPMAEVPTLRDFVSFHAGFNHNYNIYSMLLDYARDPANVPDDEQLQMALSGVVHTIKYTAEMVGHAELPDHEKRTYGHDNIAFVALHGALEAMLAAMGKPMLSASDHIKLEVREESPALQIAQVLLNDFLCEPLSAHIGKKAARAFDKRLEHLPLMTSPNETAIVDFLHALPLLDGVSMQHANILHPLLACIEQQKLPTADELQAIVALGKPSHADKLKSNVPKEHKKLYQAFADIAEEIAAMLNVPLAGANKSTAFPNIEAAQHQFSQFVATPIEGLMSPRDASAFAHQMGNLGELYDMSRNHMAPPLYVGHFLQTYAMQQKMYATLEAQHPMLSVMEPGNPAGVKKKHQPIAGLKPSIAGATRDASTKTSDTNALHKAMALEHVTNAIQSGNMPEGEHIAQALQLVRAQNAIAQRVIDIAGKERGEPIVAGELAFTKALITQLETMQKLEQQISPAEKEGHMLVHKVDVRPPRARAYDTASSVLYTSLSKYLQPPLLEELCKTRDIPPNAPLCRILESDIEKLKTTLATKTQHADIEKTQHTLNGVQAFLNIAHTDTPPGAKELRDAAEFFRTHAKQARKAGNEPERIVYTLLHETSKELAAHYSIQIVGGNKQGLGIN